MGSNALPTDFGHFLGQSLKQESLHDDGFGQGAARRRSESTGQKIGVEAVCLADHMGVGGPEMDALAPPRQKARAVYVIVSASTQTYYHMAGAGMRALRDLYAPVEVVREIERSASPRCHESDDLFL